MSHLFHPTERRNGVGDEDVIQADHSVLERLGYPPRAGQVLSQGSLAVSACDTGQTTGPARAQGVVHQLPWVCHPS